MNWLRGSQLNVHASYLVFLVFGISFILSFHYFGFLPYHIRSLRSGNILLYLQSLEICLMTKGALCILTERMKGVRSLNDPSNCLNFS